MKINFNINLELQEKVLIDKAKEVLWLVMNKAQEIAVRHADEFTDRGVLKNSISLTPFLAGASHYTLHDGVDYGIHVEMGTSPHFVPLAPLKAWARRKLGDEDLAFAVRAKIAKEGTPAQPFMRPAASEVEQIWIPFYWKRALAN